MPAPASPAPRGRRPTEADQAAALTRARWRATGLLAVVAVGFLATFLLPGGTATGYLRAALEAGMVGGLADWFAVVALFRHPLGVPIPHTAVIPRSREGLGTSLATFVEDNFLAGGQVEERIADPAHVIGLGRWLADPANADRVTAYLAGAAGSVLDAVDEDEAVRQLATGVRRRLATLEVAPLAGRSLEAAIREHRHAALVTATIEGIRDTVVRNREPLRRRLGEQSPRWVPEFVDDLVFDQAEQVMRTFLGQLVANEDHELRAALDQQLLELTDRLQQDEQVGARVDQAVQDVVTDELLERWIRDLWDLLRARLDAAARSDASPETFRRLGSEALVSVGERLQDPATPLHRRTLDALHAVAPRLADAGQRELGSLIETTVERWDVQDTSRRLELWMGRDLQFVRINGTVVGAMVGLVLHAVANLLA